MHIPRRGIVFLSLSPLEHALSLSLQAPLWGSASPLVSLFVCVFCVSCVFCILEFVFARYSCVCFCRKRKSYLEMNSWGVFSIFFCFFFGSLSFGLKSELLKLCQGDVWWFLHLRPFEETLGKLLKIEAGGTEGARLVTRDVGRLWRYFFGLLMNRFGAAFWSSSYIAGWLLPSSGNVVKSGT